MTWFAIRTLPGAQLPQREYQVEPTMLGANGRPRGKGYRIVPSLDPDQSAVERALSNAGFAHYMPVEKRLVRDRRKTDLWKGRRFPLLLGYVFVQDVTDFRTLEETAGVAGIVGTKGEPIAIPEGDIAMLRGEEAKAEEKYLWEVQRREEAARRVTRNKAKILFPVGSRVLITKGIAQGRTAHVIGTDRGGRLKAFTDSLNGTGTISVSVDAVLLVA